MQLRVVLATSIPGWQWFFIHVGWRLFVSMRWSLHPTPTPGGTCFCPCGRDAPHRPGWHSTGRECRIGTCQRSKTALHECARDCMPRMCTNISHTHVKHRPLGIRGFPLSATLNTRSGLAGFIRVYPGLSGSIRVYPGIPRPPAAVPLMCCYN